jgi:hypothetical protein
MPGASQLSYRLLKLFAVIVAGFRRFASSMLLPSPSPAPSMMMVKLSFEVSEKIGQLKNAGIYCQGHRAADCCVDLGRLAADQFAYLPLTAEKIAHFAKGGLPYCW